VAARKSAAVNVKAPPTAYVIEGSHDPALFFAWELLDSFIGITDLQPSRAAQARVVYKRGIEAQGWEHERFWRDVEAATSTYVATRRQQMEHRRALASSRKASGVRVNGGIDGYLADEVCYERAQALENLRQRLGREPFDKFLYNTVAPGVTLMITMQRNAGMLMRIERGCR